MDDFGITPEQYASGLQHMWITSYLYYVALSLFIYDSLCLMSREVDYIHRGKWTFIRVIYLSLRLWTFSYLIFAVYVWTHNFLPARLCTAYLWYRGLSIDIMLTAVVKILFVLRLRALWGGNLFVTVILLLATAAELIINSISTFAVGIINQKYMLSGFPLWSCYTGDTPHHEGYILQVAQSGLPICRLVVSSVEVGLTLVKLGLELSHIRLVGNTVFEKVAHVKSYTPIIYVFYRDGILFFIPFSVMSVFALLSVLTLAPNSFNPFAIDWTPWVATVYYLCGTRLILNVREANCKLTRSIYTGPEFSMLQFRTRREDEYSQNALGGVMEEAR